MSRPGADVDETVQTLTAGGLAVIATDTVYGLVASVDCEAAISSLYAVKRRPAHIPLSLLASDLDMVFSALPELDGPRRAALGALLPGPYTVVVPDCSSRFRSLRGESGSSLGIRVPVLPPRALAVVAKAGPLASTSANLHGQPDSATIDAVAAELLPSVGAVLDDGELAGLASTVIDVSGEQPTVLRVGAVPEHLALARLRGAGSP